MTSTPTSGSSYIDAATRVARIAGIGVLVGMALTALTASALWSVHADAMRSAVEVAEARADLLRLDEVLTMSAYMASATGEPGWEDRHTRNAPLLDAALARAALLAGAAGQVPVAQINAANVALLAMEHRAFALARAGAAGDAARFTEARQILRSAEYEREKSAYSTGVAKIDQLLAQQLEASSRFADRIRLGILVLLGSVALAAAASGRVFDKRMAALRHAYERIEAQARDARDDAALATQAAAIGILRIHGGAVTANTYALDMLGPDIRQGSEVAVPDPLARATSRVASQVLDMQLERGGRVFVVRGRAGGGSLDAALVDMTVQVTAERTAQRLASELEERVRLRTAALAELSERNRQLALHVSEAEMAERRRLAGLLHEDVQQLLAAARLQAASGAPGSTVVSILDDALRVTRALSHDLAPVEEDTDLVEAVDHCCRLVSRWHGLDIRFAALARPAMDALVVEFARTAVRELLFNVVKHARTGTATVSVDVTEAWVRIVVEDDGVGMSGPAGTGLGHSSIAVRLRAFGGDMEIDGDRAPGTRVTLRLPHRPSV